MQVILLTGQSGVGKTTIAFEMSAILRKQNIKHALIDTDELDRIYPEPENPELLSKVNLKAVWENFEHLGCDRLIICGVFAGQVEVPRWINEALGEDIAIKMFRLYATEQSIHNRLKIREIGSLLEQHIASSRRAADINMASNDRIATINTDGRNIGEVATEIIDHANWM